MTEIVKDESGAVHAVTGDIAITVLPDGPSTAFKRRAIKIPTSGDPSWEVEWLVCELNGVRLYINGRQAIMTTQDLNP